MDPIEKLQIERQNLVARLAAIDKILTRHEEVRRLAQEFLDTRFSPTSEISPTSGSDSAGTVRFGAREMPRVMLPRMPVPPPLSSFVGGQNRQLKTPMDAFEREVLEILAAAEMPLDRTKLYEALRERGVVIGSSDEASDLNTLSARMSRMANTTNVRGHGYWLKNRPFLEGGYIPSQSVDGTEHENVPVSEE